MDSRIAYCPDLGFAKLNLEVAHAVDVAAKIFETLGAHVELADPGIGDTTPIFNTHWFVGVANALGGLPDDKLALLDPGLGDFVRKGRSISLMDYLTAQNKRVTLGQTMRTLSRALGSSIAPHNRGSGVSGQPTCATRGRRRRLCGLDFVFLSVQPHASAGR